MVISDSKNNKILENKVENLSSFAALLEVESGKYEIGGRKTIN